MLPFHLPGWEIEATMRASIQEAVQASIAPFAASTLLSGGEIACDASAEGPRASFAMEGRAHYARALDISGGGGAPSDDLSADGSATATWSLSPDASFTLSAEGSLATTWGIRADSLLLARDPFLEAKRLEYGLGAEMAYALVTTPRTELGVDAGFSEEGALASDVPAVVGLDMREGHGGVSYSIDVAPRIAITPELRYGFTHYEHALLDVDRRRGPADIHALSATLGASRELAPNLFMTASFGGTMASPMPIAATRDAVLAPEAALGLRWKGRRAEINARYTWSYSSLGPRIGSGQQHTATVRFTCWPFSRPRGIMLRGLVRASHGATPIGADPPPALPGMPPPPMTGTLVATKVSGRAMLEIPLSRGWALTSGLDLVLARGHLDPAPPGGEPRQALTGMLTIGLAATISTDKRRLFPRDPGSDEDDATRRASLPSPMQRLEDRTRIDEGRSQDDAPRSSEEE
ncbi:Hypothetical protein A7982_01623 [Minicystis rosea]|nr:Hypothetical protein A7982_01623 [Minicystis rosea]